MAKREKTKEEAGDAVHLLGPNSPMVEYAIVAITRLAAAPAAVFASTPAVLMQLGRGQNAPMIGCVYANLTVEQKVLLGDIGGRLPVDPAHRTVKQWRPSVVERADLALTCQVLGVSAIHAIPFKGFVVMNPPLKPVDVAEFEALSPGLLSKIENRVAELVQDVERDSLIGLDATKPQRRRVLVAGLKVVFDIVDGQEGVLVIIPDMKPTQEIFELQEVLKD